MSRRLVGAGVGLGLAVASLATTGATRRPPNEPLSWQPAAGPLTGIARLFVQADSGTVFAWVEGDVYRSRDDGLTWQRCEGLPTSNTSNAPWMFTVGSRLYAIREPGRAMSVSNDECASSQSVALPPGTGRAEESVTSVDGVLLAAYAGPTLFRSEDAGAIWTTLGAPAGYQPRLVAHGGYVYLLASGRLHRSSDRGMTWTPLGGQELRSLITGGRHLFAAGLQGLLRSEDAGRTWNAVIRSSPHEAATAHGGTVYVADRDAIAHSADEGVTWTRIANPSPRHGPFALHRTARGTLLAGKGIGIFRWSGTDERWTLTGVPGRRVQALVAHGGRAYAIVSGALWGSDDAGRTWSRIETSFAGARRPLQWPEAFQRLFLSDDGVLLASTDRALISSTDGGRTWTSAALEHGVYGLTRSAGTWYAATASGIFRSPDFAEWRECSSGLTARMARSVTATAAGDLIVQTESGLFRSTDGCRSWWPLPGHLSGVQSHPAGQNGRPMPFSDSPLGIVLLGKGISRFDVRHRTWTSDMPSPVFTDFARDGRGRYWLGSSAGVYRLDTEGPVWRAARDGPDGSVSALAIDPAGVILVAVEGRGIFRASLNAQAPTVASYGAILRVP
jgi:photosystem II stability/assembly factor-like uncharacterized protein